MRYIQKLCLGHNAAASFEWENYMNIEEVEKWLCAEANVAEKMCEKLQYRWIMSLWGSAFAVALAFVTDGWWQVGAVFVTALAFGQSLRDMNMSNTMLHINTQLKTEYHLLRLRNSSSTYMKTNLTD